MGLIAQTAPTDELMPRARAVARGLAEGASVALGMTKTLLDQSWQLTLEQVSELEAFSQSVCRSSSDHLEGLAAFSEKRPAAFTGT